MADVIRVKAFTTPAGAGDFDVTHSDITGTPKAVVVLFSATNTDDSNQAHAVLGVGFAADDGVSTNQVDIGQAARAVDGGASPLTGHVGYVGPTTDILIGSPTRTGGSSFGGRHDFVSFITGGVRLNAVTVTDRTNASALLFEGVSRAVVGQIAGSTTLQTETVGGISPFRPDLLIISTTEGGFAGGGTFGNDAYWAMGFVIDDGSSTQVSFGADWDTATEPSDADAEASTNRGSVSFNPVGRAVRRVTFTITSTGFTHDLTEGAGAPDMAYLAIKFSEDLPLAVGVAATPTSPDSAFAVSTGSVTPQAVLGMSCCLAASDTTTSGATAGGVGYFMFTSGAERAYAVNFKTGISAAHDSNTRQGDHAVLTLDEDALVRHQAEWVSFGAGNFTLNFTSAGTGRLVFLAIGQGSQTLVSNDTEEITDGAVLHGTMTLVVGETVEIADGFVGFTNEIVFGADPQGTAFQAWATRGTSLQGGAVAGTTLD